MWLAKNGCFVYWSEEEHKALIYYNARDVANAVLKKINNSDSAKPWTFQVHITTADGLVFEPGEFAAETKQDRDRWLQEFRKLTIKAEGSSYGAVTKVVVAGEDVNRLG